MFHPEKDNQREAQGDEQNQHKLTGGHTDILDIIILGQMTDKVIVEGDRQDVEG